MIKFNECMLGSVAVLATTLITMSSCRQINDDQFLQDNIISIMPEVSTKGAAVTTSNMTEFVSFAYNQGYKTWAQISTAATADLMWNNKYTGNGSSWNGDIRTFWPDDDKLKKYSFFAYSPKATADNGITLTSTKSTVGYQTLRYQTLANVTKHVDLVIAERLNQTQAQSIPLSFKHALTRVGFTAYTDQPGVTVKSISINGVQYKGDIEMRKDAIWANVSADKTNFEAVINSGEISQDVATPTSLVGANGENYFMLLPQDLSSNTDKGVCITIVTSKDGKENTLSHTIKQDYGKGKAILYKLFIKNSVDLIIDWNVTEWSQENINTPLEGTYLNVSALYIEQDAGVTNTFVYTTDYTGAVRIEEVGTTGLTINHTAATKTFTVAGTTEGDYKVDVIAGKLTREVKIKVLPVLLPSLSVGRFAGVLETKVIDANTTRYYYSKRLFAATDDESSTYQWATASSITGATDIFDGKGNTAKLNSSAYPAAYACAQKSPAGTWYLPAQNQLMAMWIAKPVLGSFATYSYWSSTEASISRSWNVYFDNGGTYNGDGKSTNYGVRCVREVTN